MDFSGAGAGTDFDTRGFGHVKSEPGAVGVKAEPGLGGFGVGGDTQKDGGETYAAPVDSQSPDHQRNWRVFADGNAQYSCTLNQSNVALNNNKFYKIQLLEDRERRRG